MKTSKAQIRASRRWENKNKEKNKIDASRRQARSFIRRYATDEDIKNLLEIYKNENPNAKKEG